MGELSLFRRRQGIPWSARAIGKVAVVLLVTTACRRASPPIPKTPLVAPTASANVQSAPALVSAAAVQPQDAAAAPVPAAAVAAPAAAPLCGATVHKSFHLRPGPTLRSKGPQYAAGTELDLLEPAELTRFGARLFKVRVRKDGRVGFAFVGIRDLAPVCTATWEDDPTFKKTPNAPIAPGGECLVRKPVRRRQCDDLLTRDCKEPSDDSHDAIKLDLNGDGRMDSLLNIPNGRNEYQILAVHTAAGWTGYQVNMGSSDADGVQANWIAPIRTPSAVYARLSHGTQYDGGDDEPDRTINYQTVILFRVRQDGALFEVWGGDVEGGEDGDWAFKDAGDGSLMIVGKSGRLQRLRWDPVLWRLVPQRISLKPQVL